MSTRPKLAVVTTMFHKNSHSDVIVSRWLEPLPTDRDFGWPVAGHDVPRADIVSMHIVQVTERDTGHEVAKKHNLPLYATVREALTLGGDELAVDGVLLIGEHGDYPLNEWHQKMYPRRELFDEIVEVFKESGRCVPVFNDKHLSYDMDSASHMVETAAQLGFPLMAGSTLPVGGFIAPWELAPGIHLKEGLAIFYGSFEAYGYHSIEFLQSVVAGRAGGESGIKNITVYRGDGFWEALENGVWSEELMQAAIKCAATCAGDNYRENLLPPKQAEFADNWPIAVCFEHNDGLKTAHLLLDGQQTDFSLAVETEDGIVHSGCSRLSQNTDVFFAHFAQFNAAIEEFVITGKPNLPIQHTLLCTLAIASTLRAAATPGEKIATPRLNIAYGLHD